MQNISPQQQGQQIENVSAFPPPPPFYKLYLNYTKDQFKESLSTNILTSPPQQDEQMNTDDDKDKKKDKKIELNKPLPPPLPPKMGSNYVQFGQTYSTVDMLPSLDESGSKQLYPKGDIEPISELKKLNRSILFNYLQLLETLIENPTNYQKKIDDISLLFINFHHLLNSYRPHQARETLLSIMNEQIKQKYQSNENIKKSLEICKESIRNSFKNLNIESNINNSAISTTSTSTTTSNSNINTISQSNDNNITQQQQHQQNNNINNNNNNNDDNVNMNEVNWMDQLLEEMLKIN